MKKTLEIECPDGYKPVFNTRTGRVEIVPEDITAIIKTYEDARKYLGYLSVDSVAYSKSTNALAKLHTILDALNKRHKFDLLDGEVWCPKIKFYGMYNTPENTKVVGKFRYKGKVYTLAGEAVSSYFGGLSYFTSYHGVGAAYSAVSILACKSKEIAEYVLTQFAKLIFDAYFARHFQDGEFEWID